MPIKKVKKPLKVNSDSDIEMVDSPPEQANGRGKAKAEELQKRKSYVY